MKLGSVEEATAIVVNCLKRRLYTTAKINSVESDHLQSLNTHTYTEI